jgi:hypothetical protein
MVAGGERRTPIKDIKWALKAMEPIALFHTKCKI